MQKLRIRAAVANHGIDYVLTPLILDAGGRICAVLDDAPAFRAITDADELDHYDFRPPTLGTLGEDGAQLLLEDLWRVGLRPKELGRAVDPIATVTAQDRHIDSLCDALDHEREIVKKLVDALLDGPWPTSPAPPAAANPRACVMVMPSALEILRTRAVRLGELLATCGVIDNESPIIQQFRAVRDALDAI